MQKLRTAFLFLIATFLLLIFLALSSPIWFAIITNNSSIENIINRYAHWNERKIHISGLSFPSIKKIQCETLEIQDKKGTWLQLQRLDFKWDIRLSPLSFIISSAQIGKIDFRRLPQNTTETASYKSSQPFSLKIPQFSNPPIGFSVSKITIKEIALNKAVLGTSLNYSFQGNIALFPYWTDIKAKIISQTPENGYGFFHLIRNQQDKLLLKTNIKIPTINNIQIPRGLMLKADGRGYLQNWSGKIILTAPETGTLTNTLLFTAEEKTLNLDLQSTLNFEKKAANLQSWLGKSPSCTLKATINNNTINCERLYLQTKPATITLNGNFRSERLVANIITEIRDISRLEQFGFQIGKLKPIHIALSGPYNKIDTAIKLGGEYFIVPGGYEAHDIKIDITGNCVPSRLETFQGKLDLKSSKMIPHTLNYHNVQLKSNITSTFTDLILNGFSITSQEFALRFLKPVTIDKNGIAGNGRLFFDRYNVASLLPYLGKNWQGNIFGYIDAKGHNADWQYDLLFKSGNLLSPWLELKQLAKKEFFIKARGELTPNNIFWEKSRVFTPEGFVFSDGKVDWEKKTINIRFRSEQTKTALLHKDFHGLVSLKGNIVGVLSQPEVFASLASSKIGLKQTTLSNVLAQITLKTGTQKGLLHAEFRQAHKPLELHAEFGLQKKAFELFQTKLNGEEINADFSGKIDYSGKSGNFYLRADSKNIHDLAKQFGASLYGSIGGEIQGSWQQEKLTGQFSLAGSDFGCIPSAKGRFSLTGSLDGSFLIPEFQIQSQIHNLPLTDDKILHKVKASINGTPQNLTTSLQAIGRLPFLFSFFSHLKIKKNGERVLYTLQECDGTIGPDRLFLTEPTRLWISPQKYELQPCRIILGNGFIELGGKYASELALYGKLHNISSYLPSIFLPVQEYGTLNLQTELHGTPTKPICKTDFFFSKLIPDSATSNRQGFSLAGKSEYRNGLATLNAEFGNKSTNRLTIKTTAPLLLDFSRSTCALNGICKNKLNGVLELNWLSPLLGLDDHILNAMAAIDIEADYSPQNGIQLSGKSQIRGGKYEFLTTGTVLRHLNLVANFDKKEINLKLQAKDNKKGTLNAVAAAQIGELPSFLLKLHTDNLLAYQNDFLNANLTSDLHLEGNIKKALLSGDVKIHSATLNLPEYSSFSIPDLEVREIDSRNRILTTAQKQRRQSPLHFNVHFSADKNIFIQGRGLESEWKGDVILQKDINSPILNGSLEIINGKYIFAGREFQLDSAQQGKVQFIGNSPPNPTLSLTGTAQLKDLLIKLQVEGVSTNFSLTLTSEPAFPQDEILSRVLFGRSLNKISPIQALHLAQTLSDLSGSGEKRFNLINDIKNTLKIDTLRVESTDNDSTSLAAGKYVTDKIYIELEKNQSEEDNLSVEVELTPQILLDTEIGGTNNGKVELQWKLDY